MLRQGCTCSPCTAKRAEWERRKPPKAPPKRETIANCEGSRRLAREAQREYAHHVLYRFFNDAGHLLYVGITHTPERFKDHSRSASWFGEASHVTLEHFSNRTLLQQAERQAIQNERPRCNTIRYALHSRPESS